MADAPRSHHPHRRLRWLARLQGPRSWALSALLGAAIGLSTSAIAPAAPDRAIPLWLCIPFALLLLSIAALPLISGRFWARHYPDIAFFFGAIVAAYYAAALGAPGRHALAHAATEYYTFIALVGGLYTVSGGILLSSRARGSPLANTALLAAGALLANLVGTTGASVLLIRPFMRMNTGRLRGVHIALFIFIVSNCGGCLTPIGDPPLYLGFIKGVPFTWTATHLWPMWLTAIGALLAIFFVIDRAIGRAGQACDVECPPATQHRGGLHLGPIHIRGGPAILCLALLIAAVFITPALSAAGAPESLQSLPIGATIQIAIAALAWRFTRRTAPDIHDANHFHFHPVAEVALLFVGIFITMTPALGYLREHAPQLGLRTPGQYYLATGSLSAALDNAPTYLSFLQVALGTEGLDVSPDTVRRFLAPNDAAATLNGPAVLTAISLGAVFFGALTYIGNGPNFMVKSIAESYGVRMPSFPAYTALALAILGPILAIVWIVFLR